MNFLLGVLEEVTAVVVIAVIVSGLTNANFRRKAYAWCLHLYPPSYYQRFGAEMLVVFLDRCTNAYKEYKVIGVSIIFLQEMGSVVWVAIPL